MIFFKFVLCVNFIYQYSICPYLNQRYSFAETAKYCNNYSSVAKVDDANYDFLKQLLVRNNVKMVGIQQYNSSVEYVFTDMGIISKYDPKKYFITNLLIMRIIDMSRQKYQ